MRPDDPASMHVELTKRITCMRCGHFHRVILALRCGCCRADLNSKKTKR